MRRVISILLILMQSLFFINFFMNEGTMFFNLYFWGFTAVFGALLGLRSWKNGAYLYESELIFKVTCITLSVISAVSMVFIIFLLITRPYLL